MTGGWVRAAAMVLLVLTLGVLGWAVDAGSPSTSPGKPIAGSGEAEGPPKVVVVGVPGWSWSDITEATPTLRAIEATGASGSLVVRGAYPVTCPADGWLTLGAGQRAAIDEPEPATRCAVDPVALLDTTADDAVFPDFPEWQAAANDRALTAELGLLDRGLAAGDECVAAYGPLAAFGAASAGGVVSRYNPDGLAE
ncbi:MAG: hypothetical protein WA962_03750, partial [Ornithinimicrobium sp.]